MKAVQHTSLTGDALNSDPAEHHGKVSKPSATEVANKLFNILLISDPMSVVDICKLMPEIPRESVQSVLEVLQVLGLVMQCTSAKETTSSRSSSANSVIYLYSMTEFAKFSSAFPITNLEAELKSRVDGTKTVIARNEQLQDLTTALEDDTLEPERRTELFKEMIDKMLVRSPELWEDPIYQALIEQLGCSSQPLTAQR